jgi:hypothetical protein
MMFDNIRATKQDVMDEIRLLKTNPHAFMVRQIRKLLEVGESGRLMDTVEFKSILKDYVERGEIPKE